ncbi:MAG: ABC transporter ATP-binding protein [Pseudomonadales bacterium]|nr:ABC transporter ATP-binding protein [Pseudomonadales bacterium]
MTTHFAWRMFRQSLKTREAKILLLALVIAVGAMTNVALFAQILNSALLQGSSELLAADRQIKSSRPLQIDWQSKAEQNQLQSAQGLGFSTMLASGDNLQLVSVKAVSEGYPLKGKVLVSDSPGGSVVEERISPEAGTVWLSPRLFNLLSVNIGDVVSIGNAKLKVTRVLVREPDLQFGFSQLAPRVMMNFEDAMAAGIVQPGSRVTYRYYFSGTDIALSRLEKKLVPELLPSAEWISVKEGRPAVARALDKAESYSMLGASLAVLLAIVAISVCSRHFANQHVKQVGILKALGLTSGQLMNLYLRMFLIFTLLGAVIGTILAGGILVVSLSFLDNVFALESVSVWTLTLTGPVLLASWGTAFLCMFCFIVPLLRHFKGVSPAVVLASVQSGERFSALFWLMPILGMIVLVYYFTGNAATLGAMALGLCVLFVLVLIIYRLLTSLVASTLQKRIFQSSTGQALKLALNSFFRRRWQVQLQLFAFAMAIMIFSVLYLVRTSMLSEWQAQLPEGTPNHFLINIAPYDFEGMEEVLSEHGLKTSGFYPMVRGRLVEINDIAVKEAVSKEKNVNALNRELNLTWAKMLPADNELLEGVWWQEPTGDVQGAFPAVSIESKLAERLDVTVNDVLTFQVGAQPFRARVTSVRSVQWDSMRPNFYMIFEPGALSDFPATYITSFHLEPGNKSVLNAINQQFPMVTVLELDQLIARIQHVIGQVSFAVELVMGLILVGAVLVMMAIVNVTLQERLQEGAIYRALGGSRRLVQGGQVYEFAIVGLVSACIAFVGAEVVVALLMTQVFDLELALHWQSGMLIIFFSALGIALIGWTQLRRVIRVSPASVLQSI